MNGDLDVIKTGLIDRMKDVCQALLPTGREEGGQWVSYNPVENDFSHANPALKIRLRGGVVGAWKDWRSGDKGDALGLVAYILRTDTSGALVWGRDFLGLKAMSRADRENMKKVAAVNREKRARDDEKRRAQKLAGAQKLFWNAQAKFSADRKFAFPAQLHAERYFEARGVPLADIPTLNPDSFAFSPETEWWKGATWKNDGGRRWKEKPGPNFPAIHSAMRNALGNVTCCHVTFLDPVKPKKAPVDPPKLMFGEALGAAIEISMGPNNVPFWQDDGSRPKPVVLAEGIETALAFAVAGVPARVWACGSLAGVGHAPIELPCISWIMFARDNNHGNAQAQKQFSAALEKLEASGKRVDVQASHVGDDFNDLAQGEE